MEPLRNAAAPMIFGHGPSEIAIGCEIRLTAGEIALRAVEVSLRDDWKPYGNPSVS